MFTRTPVCSNRLIFINAIGILKISPSAEPLRFHKMRMIFKNDNLDALFILKIVGEGTVSIFDSAFLTDVLFEILFSTESS